MIPRVPPLQRGYYRAVFQLLYQVGINSFPRVCVTPADVVAAIAVPRGFPFTVRGGGFPEPTTDPPPRKTPAITAWETILSVRRWRVAVGLGIHDDIREYDRRIPKPTITHHPKSVSRYRRRVLAGGGLGGGGGGLATIYFLRFTVFGGSTSRTPM